MAAKTRLGKNNFNCSKERDWERKCLKQPAIRKPNRATSDEASNWNSVGEDDEENMKFTTTGRTLKNQKTED